MLIVTKPEGYHFQSYAHIGNSLQLLPVKYLTKTRWHTTQQPFYLSSTNAPGAPSVPPPCSTYYLRATSDSQCRAIIESITKNARRAREAAEKRSRLRRMQASVLVAYESTPFQSFVALLIIAVHSTRAHGGA